MKQLKDYDGACQAYQDAIKMDISDPNDIGTELLVCQRLAKAKEKQRVEKMSGFLKDGL